jgi:multisubunit Na+/H+ antiporter MnhG subunit
MMQELKKIDWVKWIIIALGAWLLVYPKPYKVLVTLLVVIPLITLIIHGVIGRRPTVSSLFDGLLDNQSSFSPVAHLTIAMVLLGFRVFIDYDPESMLRLLGVGLVSTFALCLLLLATHKIVTKEDDLSHFVMLSFLLLFFAPTSMFAINCVYHNTQPQVHQVKVLEKYRPTSKPDADYYLKVASWLPDSEPVSIEVSLDKYYNAKEGDLVNVHVGEGLFRVGWYYIEL